MDGINSTRISVDPIDWLLKNIPGHNGRLGLWGLSYPGFYAAAGLIDAHPALKAVSPNAPVSDWFSADDWHHNGAFLLDRPLPYLCAGTFWSLETISQCHLQLAANTATGNSAESCASHSGARA